MTDKPDYKAEMDFGELVRSPRRLFGYALLYFLVVLLVLGMSYVQNLGAVGRNSIPYSLPVDSSGFVEDIPLVMPSVLPPLDLSKAGNPSDSLVARGRTVFQANCISCHGETGSGDGPAGSMLQPPPRNFHSVSGWTNGPSLGGMFKTLAEGIPRTGMASYSYLSPGDRFALIHYVRTFVPGAPPVTREELEQLDATYALSRGRDIPGQIPVTRAMRIIEREGARRADLVAREAAAVSRGRDGGEGQILRRYSENTAKFLAAFAAKNGDIPSLEEFRRMVIADPVAVGLHPSVVFIHPEEWMVLYRNVVNLRTALLR